MAAAGQVTLQRPLAAVAIPITALVRPASLSARTALHSNHFDELLFMIPNNQSRQYIGRDLEAMSFAKNYHYWILEMIKPYIRGAVAEVGAGTGNFSKLLLKADIASLTAFEPSENVFHLLSTALASYSSVTPVNDFFGASPSIKKFDTICYINVLEHIEDDAGELRIALERLSPSGHLILFVPALQWLYSNFDRQIGHFRRYRKSDLITLVEQCGFKVVDHRYFDISGIIPWYINLTLLGGGLNPKSVSLYDRFIVPTVKQFEKVFRPPVGKNVLIVATKHQEPRWAE